MIDRRRREISERTRAESGRISRSGIDRVEAEHDSRYLENSVLWFAIINKVNWNNTAMLQG